MDKAFVQLNRSDVIGVLDRFKHCIEQGKGLNPLNDFLRVTATHGLTEPVTLIASQDDGSYIDATISSEAGEGTFDILVNRSLFNKIVTAATSPSVKISVEGNSAVITAGARFKTDVLAPEPFSVFKEDWLAGLSPEIEGEKFSPITFLSQFVDRNLSFANPYSGVYVHDGSLMATNKVVGAVVARKEDDGLSVFNGCLIPPSLFSFLERAGSAQVSVGKSQFIVVDGAFRFRTSFIDAEFPHASVVDLIEKLSTPRYSIEVAASDYIAAVRRVTIILNKEIGQLKMIPGTGCVQIQCDEYTSSTSSQEEIVAEIGSDSDTSPWNVCFNVKAFGLFNAIAKVGNQFTFVMSDPKRPVLLKTENDDMRFWVAVIAEIKE